jgi:hypothetical protein
MVLDVLCGSPFLNYGDDEPFSPLERLCLFSGKMQGPRGQQTFAVDTFTVQTTMRYNTVSENFNSPTKGTYPGVPYVRAAIYTYIINMTRVNPATITGPFRPRSENIAGLARVVGPLIEIG